MKTLTVSTTLVGAMLVALGVVQPAVPRAQGVVPETSATGPGIGDQDLIEEYCVRCHNERRLRGNLSLETFDVTVPHSEPSTAEKMIVKLRSGMMPPPGAARPDEAALLRLVETLETRMDRAADERRDPGGRTFQRLNRAEYARSIESLLGLNIDPANYLPLDTKSENFDNIADVQMLSPTLLDAYLTAAADIARLAVGDLQTANREHTYSVSGYMSQADRVEGAPYGTRGGTSVVHNFPADGDYSFTICLLYTSPSPRDLSTSRMPSSA